MGAHGSMYDRDWSELQNVLRKSGVTHREIGELCAVDKAQVNRVLNKGRFGTVKHQTVLAVRNAICKLLPHYTDKELMKMFAEYDRELLS
ncbi:MAG: hypothetical protein ACRBHB_18025 [Arenicella sp.]